MLFLLFFLFLEIQSTTTEGIPPPATTASTFAVTTSLTTSKTTTTKKTRPILPNWRPCTACGNRLWPSYCMGWYCRRRWPYHQFYPSRRRCYSCKCDMQIWNKNYSGITTKSARDTFCISKFWQIKQFQKIWLKKLITMCNVQQQIRAGHN